MLEHINDLLSNIINYELDLWTQDIDFPYWVGSYQEIEYDYEQEYQEYDFTLTGTNRGTLDALIEDKDKIKTLFKNHKAVLLNGHSVAIFYERGDMIPSEDEKIKRMEVHLNIKEWGY